MNSCKKEGGIPTHNMHMVTDTIMKCYCGSLNYKRDNKSNRWITIKMKNWRIDFTIERYGDMVIKAQTQEDAKRIFDKQAREKLGFTHGHTYDWDIRTNYAVEEVEGEGKPPFDFYQPSSSLRKDKLVEELFSPLYSQGDEYSETDPLVSYAIHEDGPNDLPWI